MKQLISILFGPLAKLTTKQKMIAVYFCVCFGLLCGEPCGWRPMVIYYGIVLINFGCATHLLIKNIHINDDEDEDSKD